MLKYSCYICQQITATVQTKKIPHLSDRVIQSIIPDGNCLFRCFAQHLLGDQEKHDILRQLLIQFELLNNAIFKVYLTSNQSSSIEEHCQLLNGYNSWGTQVEIIAVATYFHVPVYIYKHVPSTGDWKWTCTQPIQNNDLRYPRMEECFTTPSHFELCYAMNHYDCIVSKDENVLSTTLPVTTKSESWIEIDT